MHYEPPARTLPHAWEPRVARVAEMMDVAVIPGIAADGGSRSFIAHACDIVLITCGSLRMQSYPTSTQSRSSA